MTMLGERQKVIVLQSGHYAIRMNSARTVLGEIEISRDEKITLNVEPEKKVQRRLRLSCTPNFDAIQVTNLLNFWEGRAKENMKS